MRSIFLSVSISVLGLVAAAAPARASVWEINSAHSTAAFSVRHMMVTNVSGQFGKITGTLDLDEKVPAKSTVEVTVDATTIDTHEPKRDAHLKSPDFFDVANHPTITFKSTKVEKAGKGKYKVTGDLNMHGVAKPVTLTVEGPTEAVKNPMGGTMTRGAHASGKLNRKDWNLNWNKALEAGGVLVGDEVTLNVDLELEAKQEKPAEASMAAPAAPVPTKAAAK
ncbi:MAG TPA: YceI family protein [Polyangia bacterium]|jgi:polyisoprenoid-binding protein YceI|nr:YceI family protein [Polyangia bacterium]